MSIDLREEMKQVLEEYGWPVLYQRADRRIRCKCYDSRNQDADPHCPVCLGSGWLIRLEKHQCRSDAALQPITYPNLNKPLPVGRIWTPANVFFLQYSVNPKVGDIIIECGWSGARPTNIIQVYEINHVNPNRGDTGRLEFWEAYVKSIAFDRPKYKIALRKYGKQLTYEMPGG